MEDTRKQQQGRLYRVAVLAAGIFVYLAICWVSVVVGAMKVDPLVFLGISVLVLVGYAAMGLSILLEWNLALKHPDMRLIQAIWAVCIVILTSQFFDDIKPLVMLFGLSMIIACTNRMSRLELVAFAVFSLVIYGVAVSYQLNSGAFNPANEIISLIVIAMTLIICPLIYRMETGAIEELLAASNRALIEARWRAQDLSVVDERSGAANRRRLMEVLTQHKAMADRYGLVFSVCLIDIGPLYSNGHSSVDGVLKEFVLALRSLVREVDCVARLDTDRFVLVLCGSAQGEAEIAVERVKTRLARRQEIANFVSRCMDLSIGVRDYRAGETIKTLMERVDLALYDAKRTVRTGAMTGILAEGELLRSGAPQ
ncbi:MAG: GGDEF domain-containing protein [Pseudomonadales bacterium]|nr:GGDEF domain-containing protein [Pseudomonadales bacterium]